jgi:hypothetical protein
LSHPISFFSRYIHFGKEKTKDIAKQAYMNILFHRSLYLFAVVDAVIAFAARDTRLLPLGTFEIGGAPGLDAIAAGHPSFRRLGRTTKRF